jgi:general secretion pathway protein I
MTPVSPIRVRGIAARRRSERGFALLEILVAFLILALGLGAILVGVSVAIRSDTRTQTSRSILRVAQSRLEAAGLTEVLTPGHREGRVGANYSWRQTVTEAQSSVELPKPNGVKADSPAANGVTTFWVEVAVRASDGTVAKLAGLKIAPVARP